jgi:hypothetical protein
MSEQNPQDRRAFLRGTVAVSVGAGCLATGLREALALAALQDKPLLTEQSLNKLLEAEFPNEERHAALLKEAEANLPEFLRRRFTLTEKQVEEIKSLTAEELRELNRGLEAARAKHRKVTIRIVQAGGVDRPPEETETFPVAFPRVRISVEIGGGAVVITVAKVK